MSSQRKCSKTLKTGKTCGFIAMPGQDMCRIHFTLNQNGGNQSHNHQFIFKFKITFKQGDDDTYGQPATPAEIANVTTNELLEWYRTFGEEVTQYHFRDGCNLQHVSYKFKKNLNSVDVKVTMTYRDINNNHSDDMVKDNERLVADMFADPDDNGAHPVTGNLLIKGTLDVDSLKYSVL